MTLIPFHRVDIGEQEAAAAAETLRSGWINTGPRVRDFEQALREYLVAPSVIALSSAWAGLFLTLKAFGVGPGDEVITTPFTFAATANVIEQTGAHPVFVDISPASYTLAIEKILPALSSRTKAIIPVDYGGAPADYPALKELLSVYTQPSSSQSNLTFTPCHPAQEKLGRPLILADAAHAFGSALQKSQQKAYSGDVRVYSFHTVKNITTIDGGAVAIHAEELLAPPAAAAALTNPVKITQPSQPDKDLPFEKHLRMLSLHGIDKDAYARHKNESVHYDIACAGIKTNLTDVNAAIGLVQIERWAEIRARRENLRTHYNAAFSKSSLYQLRPQPAYFKDWDIAWHLYTLEIKEAHGKNFLDLPAAERIALRQKLLAACRELAGVPGFMANLHYTPLYHMSHYRHYFAGVDLAKAFPGCEAVSTAIFSLPFHSQLSEDEISRITERTLRAGNAVLA